MFDEYHGVSLVLLLARRLKDPWIENELGSFSGMVTRDYISS